MLVIKNMQNEEIQEGEWFEREIWGATIGFKIRPRTEKSMEAINTKFKAMRDGKKKDEAIADAYYDHILEEFNGVADELPGGNAVPWENSIENKKRLLFMQLPTGETPIYLWVINKANGLAFRVQEDEVKN